MSGKAQEVIGWGAFGQKDPGEYELAFATVGAGGGIDAGEDQEAVLPGEGWRFLGLRW